MIQIRRSAERGHFNHGWLDTFHTFSFGDYYDPNYSAFRTLRVINEDRVTPDNGFGMHGHRDMEIVTYIIEGELKHEDSMGTSSTIRRGDIQRMTAGSGVQHSETNPSSTTPVHLLQIWILPEKKGLTPGYEEKSFKEADKKNRACLLVSPTGREGSVQIHQDLELFASILEEEKSVKHSFKEGRHGWIQVVSGSLQLNGGETLMAGDGAAISSERELSISSPKAAEFLLFDLS